MNGKLYIKKFIRDDGETLSFDAEEIYLSENNTLLVRSDPATTAVEFTEEDGGEMIRQRGATYSQPVSGLIVPKSTEYWALCVRLSRFFILNHTYKIVYIKRDGSMFSMNRAWINAGLQIVPVPYENYSTWTIEFKIGDNFWTEYAEDGQGKEIYSNTVELPLLTAGTGGEVWSDVTQQTLSGSGNYFTIDGTSISASINKLELGGDTYQQTYSGKNLLRNTFTSPSTVSGITFTKNPDGTITANGTATAGINFYPNGNVFYPISEGTYTLSDGLSNPTSTTYFTYIDTNTSAPNYIYFNTAERTVTRTIPEGITIKPRIVIRQGQTLNNVVFKLMLEQGSTASSFEPYVGGIPAPNPDYPQDVQVATGEQTVKVTGKNLLKLVQMSTPSQGITTTVNSDGSITVSGTASSSWATLTSASTDVILSSGESYTFSINRGLPVSIGLITSGVTRQDFNIAPSRTSVTATANYDNNNISLYIFGLTQGQSYNFTIYPQFEKGSSVTAYEPFQSQTYTVNLGSIELCKIGDYQDKIFNNDPNEDWYNPDLEDNAWYVHKEIGKLDMSTITGWAKNANGQFYRQSFVGSYGISRSQLYSNIFLYDTTAWVSDGKIGIAANNNFWMTTGDSTLTSASDVPQWLEDRGAVLYGALVQPTNTKITGAALVAQLNALAGAQAYNGKTVYQTDSATMPAILSVELLQSVGGGEVWDNVGAVWEEGVGGVQTINVETTQTTYPVWTVTGPCSNPTLQNDTTDTLASFDGMIASGQTLTANFADNTAYLDSAPVAKYVSGYVSLAPGENVIGFNSDGGSTQTSTISWDNIIN